MKRIIIHVISSIVGLIFLCVWLIKETVNVMTLLWYATKI